MTVEQAFNIIALALEPINVSKLTRADYCKIEQALYVLREALKDDFTPVNSSVNKPS